MLYTDKLFKFPIMMVDSEEEEKRKKLGFSITGDDDPEIIYGEAEYPYYDFVGVEDRWIPNSVSLEAAKEGNFSACVVKFNNLPLMLVPWPKAKFKKEYIEFVNHIIQKEKEEEQKQDVKMIYLTPEHLKKIFGAEDIEEEKDNKEDNGKDSE